MVTGKRLKATLSHDWPLFCRAIRAMQALLWKLQPFLLFGHYRWEIASYISTDVKNVTVICFVTVAVVLIETCGFYSRAGF